MSLQARPVATARACGLTQSSGHGFNHAAALFSKRGWLSNQPPAFQHRILSMARSVQATRGAWIFAVNDPPGGIYGIVSGGIGIEGTGPYNLPRLGHVLRSGDWFGHGPILSSGDNRAQGMRALEDSELVYVPLVPLRALISEDSVAARCVGQMADAGSILGTRVISDLLIPAVPQRIAAVLLRVTAAEDGIEPHHPDGFLITQTDLGEMANVSRSNVNRVLGDFARQGWITKHYQRLRVRDVAALQAFAASQV
jgi:CRP-like cAMP-binding protein